jgi:hypothetical protein
MWFGVVWSKFTNVSETSTAFILSVEVSMWWRGWCMGDWRTTGGYGCHNRRQWPSEGWGLWQSMCRNREKWWEIRVGVRWGRRKCARCWGWGGGGVRKRLNLRSMYGAECYRLLARFPILHWFLPAHSILSWTWGQCITPKRYIISIRRHGITPQKTVIFTVLKYLFL